jgi:muramidase (phage lysozyme)
MCRLTTNDAPAELLAGTDMVAYAEIGPTMLAESDDGYNVLVGSRAGHVLTFGDYSKHPHVYNRALDSTAAGRYQMLWATWNAVRLRLKLPDFSPRSQDLACIELFRSRLAIPDFMAGNIAAAIAKCKKEWASFPGAGYNQPERSASALIDAYHAALRKYQKPDFSNTESGVATTAPKPGE